MPKAPGQPPEHAFAGRSVPFHQLYTVDHGSGLVRYRTRCGLYVPASALVPPNRHQPVPCPACQAVREGAR